MPSCFPLDRPAYTFVVRRRDLGALLAGLLGLLLFAATAGPPTLPVGHFSEAAPTDSLPSGWTEIRFGQNDAGSEYNLVRRDSAVVLQAQSTNGSSSLIRHPRISLAEYPILEWRWRVEDLPKRANVATDTTDDAAARLYVTFDYDDLGVIDRIKLALLRRFGYDKAPSRALNYIWATRHERGQVIESPYTDQIMMMPVRSGSTRAGKWITERRNVRVDYQTAFEGEPPPVNGIAIMTDTDNTGGTATALYGDIVFRKKERKGSPSE